MRHLKRFENLNGGINVGDWVALKRDRMSDYLLNLYLNKPAIIVNIDNMIGSDYNIKIKSNINNLACWFKFTDIDYFSKNIEDVNAFIQSKKYNL